MCASGAFNLVIQLRTDLIFLIILTCYNLSDIMAINTEQSKWCFTMLSNKDKKNFRQFASMVRKKFPAAKIWAFGSRVRGDATVESDLDVCVVVDKLDDASDSAIMEIAWLIGFENDVIISTVTYSTEEFEDGPCSESGLVQNILAYGIAA